MKRSKKIKTGLTNECIVIKLPSFNNIIIIFLLIFLRLKKKYSLVKRKKYNNKNKVKIIKIKKPALDISSVEKNKGDTMSNDEIKALKIDTNKKFCFPSCIFLKYDIKMYTPLDNEVQKNKFEISFSPEDINDSVME